MARARASSILQPAASAQPGCNRRLRRWFAARVRRLQRCVDRGAAACHADRYRKHFGSFSHACFLLYHGLSGGQSLRQSYDAFAECPSLVAVAGLSVLDDERLSVSFSQLAASNTSRPAAFLSGVLSELIAEVRASGRVGALPMDLRVLDSTFLRISMKLAPWVSRSSRSLRKSGVRIQMEYMPALDLPGCFLVTTDPNDCNGMDQLILDDPARLAALRDQTLVIDLGYYAHRRLATLLLAGVHWITRQNLQAKLQVEADLPVQRSLDGIGGQRITILSDQRVTVGSSNNRYGKVLHGLRLVKARVEPLPKAARQGAEPVVYELLTDRWDLEAADVVQLYLWRWQIELFFRWLKSHIHLLRLLGYSRNAVELTVALSIVVHLLTVLAARALGRKRRSPTLLRRLASVLAKISVVDIQEASLPYQLALPWDCIVPH